MEAFEGADTGVWAAQSRTAEDPGDSRFRELKIIPAPFQSC